MPIFEINFYLRQNLLKLCKNLKKKVNTEKLEILFDCVLNTSYCHRELEQHHAYVVHYAGSLLGAWWFLVEFLPILLLGLFPALVMSVAGQDDGECFFPILTVQSDSNSGYKLPSRESECYWHLWIHVLTFAVWGRAASCTKMKWSPPVSALPQTWIRNTSLMYRWAVKLPFAYTTKSLLSVKEIPVQTKIDPPPIGDVGCIVKGRKHLFLRLQSLIRPSFLFSVNLHLSEKKTFLHCPTCQLR